MIKDGAKAVIDTYRSNLQSAVRGLWRGALTRDQFVEAMTTAINRRLPVAWAEGAQDCGIKPEDYTEAEQEALASLLQAEIGYISGFADAIQESRTNRERLGPLFTRVDLWVNRYRDTRNRAKVLACKDSKMLWTIGPNEQHCRDCRNYNGRVYRGSVWAKNDIRPQHSKLACHGFKCRCSLDETDKPITKGKPPAMTG